MNRWLLIIMTSLMLIIQVQAQDISLVITVPEGNFFYYKDTSIEYKKFGFLGIALEYRQKYMDNNYFSCKLGAVLDFILPIPAAFDPVWAFVEYTGERTNSLGWFLILENQNKFDGIARLGYGLQFSSIHYIKEKWENGNVIKDESYYFTSNNFGLSTSIQSDFSNGFIMGLQYLPNLISLDKSNYSHLIIFDLGGEIVF